MKFKVSNIYSILFTFLKELQRIEIQIKDRECIFIFKNNSQNIKISMSIINNLLTKI